MEPPCTICSGATGIRTPFCMGKGYALRLRLLMESIHLLHQVLEVTTSYMYFRLTFLMRSVDYRLGKVLKDTNAV